LHKKKHTKKELEEEIKEEKRECLENEEKIKKLEEEILKNKDQFLRLAAEYENYRKRTEKDKLRIYDDAVSDAVKEILVIADSLKLAGQTENGTAEEYKKGFELVTLQFSAALKKLEVEEFGKVGDEFDPDLHSAIMHIEDKNYGKNIITEIFQPGYKIKDRIIRYAVVKVAN